MTPPVGGAPNNESSAEVKVGRVWVRRWILRIVVLVLASPIPFILEYGTRKYDEIQLATKTIYWTEGKDNDLGRGDLHMRLYTVTNRNRVKIAKVSLLAETSIMPKEDTLWFVKQPMCVKESVWQKTASGAAGSFYYYQGGEAALPAGVSFTVAVIWRDVRFKPTPTILMALDVSGVKTTKLPPGTAPPPLPFSLPSPATMFIFGCMCWVIISIVVVHGGVRSGQAATGGKWGDVRRDLDRTMALVEARGRTALLVLEARREEDDSGENAASPGD